MPLQIRQISLILRRWESAKDRRRVLRRFAEARALQLHLPPPAPRPKNLLIIRLDDIGDFLVFRNTLASYKQSPRWQGYTMTLLGNQSWQALFDLLDRGTVDRTLWLHKNRFLEDGNYRSEICGQLRAAGFETVIAPSRTRPLLLDDLCMLAAAPTHRLGCVNTYRHDVWNRLSDALYTELFTPSHPLLHEFRFNAEFAAWANGVVLALDRPSIDLEFRRRHAAPYVLCFIGGNTRSKRWPAQRWIEFIRLYRSRHAAAIVLAGASGAELAMAKIIQHATAAESIVGAVTLPEFIDWAAGAVAIVTNDTMAAHIGISCNRPTVIVTNGVNYMRFTEYDKAGIGNTTTLYPGVFSRRRARVGDGLYDYIEAVSADIASINAASVLHALESLSPAVEPPSLAPERSPSTAS